MLSRSCLLVLVILGLSSCCLAGDFPPLKDSDQQVLSTLATTWLYLPASWKPDNTTLGCYWPGILCGPDPVDPSYSTVVVMSVVGTYGPLTPVLANLTNLATFSAQSCNFQQSTIPSEFASLVNMEKFTVTYGQIAGPLPDLSAWQKLSLINLSGNSLQEFPSWIVNIPSIEYISFGSCSMNGSIPQNIGDALPDLITFTVSTNQITGDIPVSLANAKNLSTIQLQNNNFTCLPNQASSFTFLDFCNEITTCLIYTPGCPQYLHASETQYLTDLINQWSPSCLPANWSIAGVNDACNIPFEGVTCSEYWTLSELDLYLAPGTTCLSVSVPPSIFDAPYLNGLSIDGYNFDGTLPATLTTTNTSTIALKNMFITDPIPPINKYSLYALDLSGNFIAKAPNTEDFDGAKLVTLDLSFNPITGDLSFLSGVELLTLNISGCSFSGDLSSVNMMSSIGNVIDISYNQLTGSIPSALLSMDASTIIMKNNQLSGSITIGSSVYSAQTLDLSNNQLSGTLTSTMYNHNKIFLDNNKFSGSIPEVGTFNFNNYLSIRNNSLTGNIPASLSKDIYTVLIQLDGNSGMSGVIPENLTAMTQLQTFTFTGTKLQCPTSQTWNTWANTVADITCGLTQSVASTQSTKSTNGGTTNGSSNGGTTNGSTNDGGSSNGGLPDDFWMIFGSVAIGVVVVLVVVGIVAIVVIKMKNKKRDSYQLV